MVIEYGFAFLLFLAADRLGPNDKCGKKFATGQIKVERRTKWDDRLPYYTAGFE